MTLRNAIVAADESEVFFVGKKSRGSDRVDSIEVLARGNDHSAPALMDAAADGHVAIHNHPSGELMPSDADISVASVLAQSATGFFIINNFVTAVNVVVPIPEQQVDQPVRDEDIDAILGAGGEISQHMPGYEVREGQLLMAKSVAQSLSQEELLLCEAGTGTGKTFAYLVPTVLWAVRNKKTVVVSTGTINLQEQIAEKDIPFLQRGFMPEFRAVLVKGRGNFVSLRRAQEAQKLGKSAYDDENEWYEVTRLNEWAKGSRSGDRSELAPAPSPGAWERIESQFDNCLGARCPEYKDCHYYKMRHEAKSAEILIVNHHLLCADLAAKMEMGSLSTGAVLPAYDRVILDEAHKFEEVASTYFGVSIREFGLKRRLGRLLSRGRVITKKSKGLLPALLRKMEGLRGTNFDEDNLNKLAELVSEILPIDLADFGEAMQLAFDVGRNICFDGEGQAKQSHFRLRKDPPSNEHRDDQQELLRILLEARTRLRVLVKRGQRIFSLIERLSTQLITALQGLQLELKAAFRRLDGLGLAIDQLVQVDNDKWVSWLEYQKRRRGQLGNFVSAPLEAGPLIEKALWSKAKASILTSATLRTDHGFGFVRKQLGLVGDQDYRTVELVVDSPFDYGRQALLAVPDDHSGINDRSYINDTCYVIDRLTELIGGRCFALFTSYRTLQEVYKRLQLPLTKRGLVLLKQGESSRRDLIQRFRSLKGAVLFGTDSFWEGVDVPGDQLSLVVLSKIPFRVPTDPLNEARTELVLDSGGQPFVDMTLPEAILRLRQGFGRLIRSQRDRGAVVILDRRLLTRSYGPRILDSLPQVPRLIGAFEEKIVPAIDEFLGDLD